MAMAGLAWGLYSLRGRVARDPLVDTAASLVRELPLALSLATLPAFKITARNVRSVGRRNSIFKSVAYALMYVVVPLPARPPGGVDQPHAEALRTVPAAGSTVRNRRIGRHGYRGAPALAGVSGGLIWRFTTMEGWAA